MFKEFSRLELFVVYCLLLVSNHRIDKFSNRIIATKAQRRKVMQSQPMN